MCSQENFTTHSWCLDLCTQRPWPSAGLWLCLSSTRSHPAPALAGADPRLDCNTRLQQPSVVLITSFLSPRHAPSDLLLDAFHGTGKAVAPTSALAHALAALHTCVEDMFKDIKALLHCIAETRSGRGTGHGQ